MFCPGNTGTIKGAASNNCGISTKTYSITAVPTATSYVWRTDITGATINGQTGNVTTTLPNVSLTFPSNFTNAKIYVKAQNSCGASIEKSKTLSSKPAVPTAITGPVAPCKNTGNLSYSIAPVAGATSYSWTVPGALMTLSSGQGNSSIIAATKATAGPCTIKVGSTNACGTSGKKSLVVNIAACIREYEFVNNGFFFFEVPEKIDIFTTDGRLTRSIEQPSTDMSIADLPSGIYLVSMQYADHITTRKIMVAGQ
ncbi:MAG: T9SS type A sorting domain-containing protein [Bacteroidetes bacterium]|nr:T9SS type A sorting domain-containing protein [Bacteroidota bacterium]